MTSKPLFSIIIPIRQENDYLKETLRHLNKQTLPSFEVLVITDKVSGTANPAQKRNLGATMAKGEYLAFLDDDSYPANNWLENAKLTFEANPQAAAVCGPCLTPPRDNVFQKAAGLVNSSLLGSGGAGTYRNSISRQRLVDDYPSVNLIVRRADFNQVSGFDTHHWPGEDTVLCLHLTKKLKKTIIYHPAIQVFHHRRQIFLPFLKQNSRYAVHRGHFAKIYPQTSFRIGYFIPSIFTLYTITLVFFNSFVYRLPIYLYLLLLLLTLASFLHQKQSLGASLLALITIPLTHITYGLFFIFGFLKPELKFTPHQTDSKGNYLGG